MSRRRKLGAVFLLISIAMLIAGETILKSRLAGIPFLIYWMGCFLCTSLAIFVALIDMIRVRAESREAQRDLIESTVREVESERQRRQDESKRSNPRKN